LWKITIGKKEKLITRKRRRWEIIIREIVD
jgi:hypothetical protein